MLIKNGPMYPYSTREEKKFKGHLLLVCSFLLISLNRRRRNTGEKTNVVAAVWGTEFFTFLPELAVLH